MRRDTVYLGNYIPTFQGNLLQDREREKTVYSFLLKELRNLPTKLHGVTFYKRIVSILHKIIETI
jgi:hypothetical protein